MSTPSSINRPSRRQSAEKMVFDAVASLRECCTHDLKRLGAAAHCSLSMEEEMMRLSALYKYLIPEAEPELRFDRITSLTGRMFKVPIALVSFVTVDQQRFLGNFGLPGVNDTPRKYAFCAHAIMSTQDLMVVKDATKDPRFCNNALVTGEPHIRFYAGAPLVCPEGYKLGTLCIIDSKPHPHGLSLAERQNLRELSSMVVESLVLRRNAYDKEKQDQSNVIAATAHDLLTPLSGIQVNLSLLREDDTLWNALDSRQKELISTAFSCSHIMSRICRQTVQNFRHHDQTPWPPHLKLPRPDSMQEEKQTLAVITDLVTDLRVAMEPYPKLVPMRISVAEDVPPAIVSDGLKLFRSALNYLSNACNHTRTGYIHLKLYVRRTTRDHLVMEVEDTGSGVDMHTHPDFFNAFRANNLHQKNYSDKFQRRTLGLGLYSVAISISSLGGEYGFNLRSETNKKTTGTTFWFSVPIVLPQSIQPSSEDWDAQPHRIPSNYTPSPSHSVTQQFHQCQLQDIPTVSMNTPERLAVAKVNFNDTVQYSDVHNKRKRVEDVPDTTQLAPNVTPPPDLEPQMTELPPTRSKKALVIDDSITIRKSIDRALSNMGFDVHQAPNGQEGLKKLMVDAYDIVFCDFIMPVMDGLDCTQRYRTWEKKHRAWFHQYIIGISAHASDTDAERAIVIGMDKFIPKPLSLSTIKELSMGPEITANSHLLDEEFERTHQECISTLTKEETSVASIKSESSKVGTGPLCLIVEDGPLGGILKKAVKSRGLSVCLCQKPEKALRHLQKRAWDLVFFDDAFLLPGNSIHKFREWEGGHRNSKQNHIYLLGGEDAPGLFPEGFDGVLGKPLQAEHLFQILEVVLAERRDKGL